MDKLFNWILHDIVHPKKVRADNPFEISSIHSAIKSYDNTIISPLVMGLLLKLTKFKNEEIQDHDE